MNKNLPFYNLDNFSSYRIDIQSVNSDYEVRIDKNYDEISLSSEFLKRLNKDTQLFELFKGNPDKYKSGSERDMALAHYLVKLGYDDNEIASIISKAPYEKKTPRTHSYFISTLSKARVQTSVKSIQENDPQKEAWDYLRSLSLKYEDIENVEINYLIDGLLVENSLTMISGQQNKGKSILALAIAKEMHGKGRKVFYLDYDMPIQSISERIKQAKLDGELGKNLIYIKSGSQAGNIRLKSSGWGRFKDTCKSIEEHLIIIIDNLKDCSPSNTDLNDDTAMVEVMNEIKEIRDMNCTVILLHHRDKEAKNAYKNSGSIADALDVGYVLENNKGRLELKCFKNRIRVEESHSIEVTEDFTIKKCLSSELEKLTENFTKVYKAMEVLWKENKTVLQKDILETLKGRTSKQMITKILEMGKGKFWTESPGSGNSKEYNPIGEHKSENPYIEEQIFRFINETILS